MAVGKGWSVTTAGHWPGIANNKQHLSKVRDRDLATWQYMIDWSKEARKPQSGLSFGGRA